MTYNFDPDRWFQMQKEALERRRRAGELDAEQYRTELEALADRYEEMVRRLDIRHDYGEQDG